MKPSDEIQFLLVDKYANDRKELIFHDRISPTFRARLATNLLERWGLVAGDMDGEDSAGRAKLRRMTPAEAVQAACDTADEAVSQFFERGWIMEVPTPPGYGDASEEEIA